MNRGKGPPARSRRRPVVGEDLPSMRNVMKEIKDQPVTLEEFLSLISPHTGDKGAALTKVMTEDISVFRKMVIKVYDTMSQDVSDVLANEQMELAKVYSERQRLLVEKMLRCLQNISDIVPNFDFKRYYEDPDLYLGLLFIVADIPDEEEIEAARRQLAYHRLQWLQSEGERLQFENVKLQGRLKELKKVQRKEINESIRVEREGEEKKAALVRQQTQMQNKLEELNQSLHQTIVAKEINTIDKKKQDQNKALAKKRPSTTASLVSAESNASWNERAAADIESVHVVDSTISQSSISSSKPQSRMSLRTRPPFTASAAASELPAATSTLKKLINKAKSPFKKAAKTPVPSTSRLRPPSKIGKPASSTRVPKPPPVKKVAAPKKKKAAPVTDRPEWRDVDLQEFDVPEPCGARPPSPRGRATSPRPTAPPQGTCPPSCGTTPPPNRRNAGPRDTWGGFY